MKRKVLKTKHDVTERFNYVQLPLSEWQKTIDSLIEKYGKDAILQFDTECDYDYYRLIVTVIVSTLETDEAFELRKKKAEKASEKAKATREKRKQKDIEKEQELLLKLAKKYPEVVGELQETETEER